MEEEKELKLDLPKEEKKEETNPLLDVVEDNVEIAPDSVEIKISIPFE